MKASAAETELTEHNVSIGVVGGGNDFRTLSKEEIRAVLAEIGGDEQMQINWVYLQVMGCVATTYLKSKEPNFLTKAQKESQHNCKFLIVNFIYAEINKLYSYTCEVQF